VRAEGRLANVQQCSKDMRCLVRACICSCSDKVGVLNRQPLFQLFYKVVGCLFVLFFVNKGSTKKTDEAERKMRLLSRCGDRTVQSSAENGAIHPGDLLVTSSLPGHAMMGTDRSRMMGAVVGKSLGSLELGLESFRFW